MHVSQDHLEAIGVNVGQLCEITADKDGSTILGYGIAWRALDKMGNTPKLRPARMTDVLRNAFGIQEGSHVYLGPAKRNSILRADKVVLTDVTPRDYSKNIDPAEIEDDGWLTRCKWTLLNCEAFASGQTFEISLNKRIKKRFCIENVEAAGTQQGTPNLYYTKDPTQVLFGGSYESRPSSAHNGDTKTLLTTDHVGGLLRQIQKLNERLRQLLSQLRTPRSIHEGILIYGFQGTGKSLILKQLEGVRSLRAIRIDASKLKEVTSAKNRDAIRNLFKQAVKYQPSLVIMDDLAEMAPATGEAYGNVVAEELGNLVGSRVLVVAACRAPIDIDQKLIGFGRLSQRIELPIPDASARASILSIILNKTNAPEDPIIQKIGPRTHGFTGEDLMLLVTAADRNACARHEHLAPARPISQNGSLETLVDGAVHSYAAARIEEINGVGDGPTIEPSIEDFELALKEVRPTALREIFFEKPQIDWSSIGGSQAIKERFDEIIGWPLHAANDVAELGVQPEKGVLLYGPPGCSKTLTAQAVANHYDLNFIAVKGAELISMYVGESERAVREIFRKARAAAPCVIFFDEIDSIASERDSTGTKGLNVLTTLLNEMDGFESLKGVLVLAATNKPYALDSAIMRPGRFDSHIYLGPPNDTARKEIFAINTAAIKISFELDLRELSKATEGYSGAEIVSICNSAKKAALRRRLKDGDDSGVGMADLTVAIETTSNGISAAMLAEYESFMRRSEQSRN